MPENDGLFWWGLSSQLGDITDGPTNTIFMAEPLFGNRGPDTATLLAPDRQMNRVSGRSRCSATADDLVSRDATGYEGGVPVCGYTEGAFQLSEGQGNPYENLEQ